MHTIAGCIEELLLLAPCLPLTYLQAIGSLPPLYLRRAITHLAQVTQLVQASARTQYRKIGFRGLCYLTSSLKLPHLRSAGVPALAPQNLQISSLHCFSIVEKRTTTTRGRRHQKPPSPIKEVLHVSFHEGTAIARTALVELLARPLSTIENLHLVHVETPPGHPRSRNFQIQECLSYRI